VITSAILERAHAPPGQSEAPDQVAGLVRDLSEIEQGLDALIGRGETALNRGDLRSLGRELVRLDLIRQEIENLLGPLQLVAALCSRGKPEQSDGQDAG